jgi:signal transduction histidine kinase
VRFSIANIGQPLAEGEALRMFDYGFRGRNAQQNSSQGSGIGLYIVKRICDYHRIALSYTPQVSRDRSNVWHEFQIDFPFDIVHDASASHKI